MSQTEMSFDIDECDVVDEDGDALVGSLTMVSTMFVHVKKCVLHCVLSNIVCLSCLTSFLIFVCRHLCHTRPIQVPCLT